MAVHDNIQDTCIVLQVFQDIVNLTKKGLRALIDHMEESSYY